jgi:uncharacterized protein (DUF924 family)
MIASRWLVICGDDRRSWLLVTECPQLPPHQKSATRLTVLAGAQDLEVRDQDTQRQSNQCRATRPLHEVCHCPTQAEQIDASMSTNRMGNWYEPVLHFWFDEVGAQGWFAKVPALDAEIRNRFAALHQHLSTSAHGAIEGTAPAYLAAIVVLDQFSRNMFRGTPQAFAADPLALSLAEHAVASGFDQQLLQHQRLFIYLPYQHSEQLAMQVRSLQLFTELADATQLDYAQQHHDIIARFGRFPHRNAVSGRDSTAEETAFLKQHTGF